MSKPSATALDAELLIIGGGLAGLALGARLAAVGYAGRVAIVEPRRAYRDDRSWAFWARDDSRFAALASASWDRWAFSRAGEPSLLRSSPGWRYRYLRSATVYADALRSIASAPATRMLHGARAGAIHSQGAGVRVETDAGDLRARYAIDTRPPAAQQLHAAPLFQVFAGRELEFAAAVFDPSTVELMTDMRSDAQGFVFTYVLPLSTTRALVEVTRFSPIPLTESMLAADLDRLLAQRGWLDAREQRREFGRLPMGLPPASAPLPAGVFRAGTAAGALRAASGYGFLRIQAWAQHCAAALLQHGAPVGHPHDAWLPARMDRIFLHALRAQPQRAPEYFQRMATRVRADRFVRFMSECANAIDYAAIIGSLPPAPFVRAAFGAPRVLRVRA